MELFATGKKQPRHPRKFSLRSKLLIGFVALALVPMLLAGGVIFLRAEQILEHRVSKELRAEVESAAEAMEVYLSGVARDVLSLARFLEQRLSLEKNTKNWDALKDDFLRIVQAEQGYYQVRFIDPRGMEVIRVNNDRGQLSLVDPEQLQNKAQRYYFQEAMATPPGRIYLSHLDYNIEYDRPEQPPRLVARMATVVQDAAGSTRGLVVINLFGEELLRALGKLRTEAGVRVLLLNEDDGYVDMGQAEGVVKFSTGNRQALQALLQGPIPEIAGGDESLIQSRGDIILAMGEVHASTERTWRLAKFFPRSALYADLDRLRWTLGLFGLPLVLLAGIVGIIAARSLSGPIRSLSAFAESIAEGDYDQSCEVSSRDELGQLSASLNTMARSLAQSRSILLDWNRSLQEEVSLKVGALKDSEEKYRLIFEAESDAILIFDAQTRKVIEANEAAALMYGYSREELARLHVTDISAEPARSMARIDEILAGRLNQIPLVQHRKSNGETFPVEISAGTFTWGGRRMFVGIVRDITERQKIEKMKDEMLSAVSHEMRTPLTAIIGFVEFMLENPVEPEQQTEYQQIIYKEALRLKNLIDNLLSLQRLRAGFGVLKRQAVAVKPLLHEVAGVFIPTSPNHRIVISCPDDLPCLCGDEEQLHQALENLVANAIKYSPEGGTVTMGARSEEDRLVLWVKDQGMGIPEQAQEQIFERFYRIDNSDGRRVGGTGLGLPLVKEIVKAHKGDAWVSSAPGEGSTFFLRIPIMKPEDAPE